MSANQRDLGSYVKFAPGGAVDATAAGAGDATKITGDAIDRLAAGGPFESAVVHINWRTSLTAAKTLSLALEVQESADNSNWDTAVALFAATVVATGEQTALDGVTEYDDVDFYTRKRYVRYNVTPDLSHTATDTAIVAYGAVLGGAAKTPV